MKINKRTTKIMNLHQWNDLNEKIHALKNVPTITQPYLHPSLVKDVIIYNLFSITSYIIYPKTLQDISKEFLSSFTMSFDENENICLCFLLTSKFNHI